MPITLTTAHYDNTQARIAVIGIDLRNKEIVMTVEYGDTDPGDSEADPPIAPFWVPSGDHGVKTHTIKNHTLQTDGEIELVPEDPLYNILVAAAKGLCTFTDMSTDPRYIKVTETHPVHGLLDIWIELSYVSVKRQLYQWLLDEEIYAGTIV